MGDNGTTLRIFRLQRSGNHAIIGWLRRNVGLNASVLFSNCRPGDPTDIFHQVEIGVEPPRGRLGADDSRDDFLASLDKCEDVIVTYENRIPPEGKDLKDFTTFRNIKTWQNIAITRGFLNWFASYYQMLSGRVEDTGARDTRAAQSLQLVTLYRDLLNRCQSGDFTVIDYDCWIVEADYRSAILSDLDIDQRDNSIGERTRAGGGSSFDGRLPEIDPARQLSRWTQLGQDPMFLSLLRCAGQMESLVSAVAAHYPHDAEVLAGLAAGQSMEELALKEVA